MSKHARYFTAVLIFGCLFVVGFAAPVDLSTASRVAARALGRLDPPASFTLEIPGRSIGGEGGAILFHAFQLHPRGYVVVSGDTDLPPVIAYSFTGSLGDGEDPDNVLFALLRADLRLRRARLAALPAEMLAARRRAWAEALDGCAADSATPLEQWPPAGSTPTGGWVVTAWTQSPPYNNACPLDPVTHARSLAGCPAVAMAQILNYLRCTNGTRFDNGDDYYHNYAGRKYWIDNDHLAQDFPSFPDLNAALDSLDQAYLQQTPPTNAEAAALVFACAVAAQQVFTSGGSGTFSVSQAFQAFQRFSFTDAELLQADNPDLYSRLSQNIKDARPAHLAVVDAGWSTGHNLVVDGYNTDNYFHLNFGWGGSYDGWYLLPDELPYGLTVIEGLIVDIFPPAVPGDLNEDGVCDATDAVLLAACLAGSIQPGAGGFTAALDRADLNHDTGVDAVDLVMMRLLAAAK